ncbi:MAG: sigma 54-interacting transcriptional regulator [Gemmatimonadales bacterium]|nr:sigma 54-interacting transcriptional regulator [Gemmatimonadales bacterium]
MSKPSGDGGTGLSVARLLARIQPANLLSIISSLREGLLALDTDLRIISMNPAAELILGRDQNDLIGTSVCELFGDSACPQDVLAATLRSGEPVLDFQTTVQLADGMKGHVVLRTVPLRHRDGSDLGIGLILGDVTEVTTLLKEKTHRHSLGRIVGKAKRMQELFSLIANVAESEASVLIRGQSGTGKELVARAVHEASRRASGPFVQVNCSALSENLLESELFGHVRGAYTGAISDRLGRFEEANGGTIFLDEIGDVSPVVQVKLLRVLQERVIQRVGDNRSIPVDVRVVSATNRDLEHLLATGHLREDFFYRIKVVSLDIPPLCERREDIPLLVANFMEKLSRRAGPGGRAGEAGETVISAEAMKLMLNHTWPGNVRELENALEHAMVLSRGGIIEPDHFPPEVGKPSRPVSPPAGSSKEWGGQEKQTIEAALERTGWNRTKAARVLGIDRSTLWRKIKLHGLRPPE